MEQEASTKAVAAETPQSKRPQRPKVDRADQDKKLIAANANARKNFVDKFEGAALSLPIKLGNRPVIRQFMKCFDISMRNWHVATSVPRSTLGDAALANAAEQAMLATIKRVHDEFQQHVRGFKAIADQDSECDLNAIVHSNPMDQKIRVIGPVGMQLRTLFIEADRLCDIATALHAFGLITPEEHSKVMYDVKYKLRRVATSIADRRKQILQRCNELGLARPNYKQVAVDDPSDAELNSADDEPATASDAPAAAKEPEALAA